MNTTNGDATVLDAFVEGEPCSREKLERALQESELEGIMSPIYFIWNQTAIIIGG